MEVDAAGLCAIIRTCHKAGVRLLKFGDVEVSFVSDQVNNVPHEAMYTAPDVVATQEEHLGSGQVSMDLSEVQKAMLKEADEADLMISAPEEWEVLQVDRLVNKDRMLDENRRAERTIS